jgi:hypothetical protein
VRFRDRLVVVGGETGECMGGGALLLAVNEEALLKPEPSPRPLHSRRGQFDLLAPLLFSVIDFDLEHRKTSLETFGRLDGGDLSRRIRFSSGRRPQGRSRSSMARWVPGSRVQELARPLCAGGCAAGALADSDLGWA